MSDTTSRGGDHDEPTRDPEVEREARIVAWVLGEASPFEVAELERLVASEPALAAFRRRILAVHGLLGESQRERRADTLRLSPERRAKLRTAFGDPTSPADVPVAIPPKTAAAPRRSFGPGWKSLRLYFGVTAACMLVFMVVHLASQRLSREAMIFDSPEYREMRLQRARAEAAAEVAQEMLALEQAKSAEESYLSDLSLASQPVMTSSGAITTPVHRKIGMARAANLMELSTADAGSEPETVPAGGDDQRVELPMYEIKETRSAGYAAASTLAGTRMRTSLPDTSFSVEANAGGAAPPAAAASTYKRRSRGLPAAHVESPHDGMTWSAGFGDASAGENDRQVSAAKRPNPSLRVPEEYPELEPRGVPLSVTTHQYLSDVAATNDTAELRYSGRTDRVTGLGSSSTRLESAAEDEVVVLSPFMISSDREGSAGTLSGATQAESAWSRGFADTTVRPAAPPPKPAAPVAPNRFMTTADADKPASRPKPVAPMPAAIDEAHAGREPVSTFSLHVSDASFKLALAALGRGELPDPALIRPEEFYNAVDYGDPAPALGQKVACRIEQAAHPFLQQRSLVRIAMKVANSGRSAGQPLRLTVVLDTSGSMEREDRVASVRRAIEVLASLLTEADRVTLVGFARQPRLLAEAVPGDQAQRLVENVIRTPSEGGTNIEAALTLAAELAMRHHQAGAQNRIVLITDGAANLGNADPDGLAHQIEAMRGHGIAFDACGVGTDGLDDEILEALTRRGDGRYYVIDNPADADAGFARKLAGAFRPAAGNVKVQVRFNPARVGAYRLLGFEKHRLREQDFRDDRVDAAELAAEEAAVAVYQVEVLPEGEGELGDVSVRFRDMASGRMVEHTWTMPHEARTRAFDQASPTLQLAGTAALLAEALRGGALGEQVDLEALAPVVSRLRGHFAAQPRVQEMGTIYDELRRRLRR